MASDGASENRAMSNIRFSGERPRFRKPTAEELDRLRIRVRQPPVEMVLPAAIRARWIPINSGTYGSIFASSNGPGFAGMAMKVTKEAVRTEGEDQITERVVYGLLRRLFYGVNIKVRGPARFLSSYGAGSFRGEDGLVHCYVLLEHLKPAAGQRELISVQLGQPDPDERSVVIEGPPAFNAAGVNVAAGWLNVTGAGFAAKVGTMTAIATLKAAGRLVGVAEAHGIFLRDMELIWGVGASSASGAPSLHILDFDKAMVGIDPSRMEELRANDPVFPKRESRDVWGAAFYDGWSEGHRRSQLLRPAAILAFRDVERKLVKECQARGSSCGADPMSGVAKESRSAS